MAKSRKSEEEKKELSKAKSRPSSGRDHVEIPNHPYDSHGSVRESDSNPDGSWGDDSDSGH